MTNVTLTATQTSVLEAIQAAATLDTQLVLTDLTEKQFHISAKSLVKKNLVTLGENGEYAPVAEVKVVEEFVAPMVYSHYNYVQALPEAPVVEVVEEVAVAVAVAPVQPKAPQVTPDDFKAIVQAVAAKLTGNLTLRKHEEGKSVDYLRVNRNDLKVRAFEFHRNTNKFRIYSGATLVMHDALLELGAQVKPGNHVYYDFDLNQAKADEVLAALS